ncbi:MAG TPA: TrmH family RNA methyltransferase, partial [Chitinophagaceae bacterium]|nr:TrmH family RNA methyltransferase [Chitinophagaceae bacterium]
VNAAGAIEQLRAEGYKVFAVEQAQGSIALQEFNRQKHHKIALIFGNEVTGVEQSTILMCDGCIEIPQMGTKHSLNIATAAGIVLWEMIRVHIGGD